jgi:adenylyltransferase/sulfurtransferase
VEAIPVVADLIEVGLGVVAAADVVISCFDSVYGRIVLNRHCATLGKPWVNGGLGDAANVFKGALAVFHAPDGPCFECFLSPGRAEKELVARLSRGGCGEAAQAAKELGAVPSTPTMASILGGLQVQEALKILHAKNAGAEEDTGLPEPAWGNMIQYFTAAHSVVVQRAKPATACRLHAPTRHRSLPAFSRTEPLRTLWEVTDLAEDAFIGLPAPVVRTIDCVRCGPAVPVMRSETGQGDICPTCGGQGRPDTFWYLSREDAEASHSLADFHFPPGSHLRVLEERETILTWPGMLDEVRCGRD